MSRPRFHLAIPVQDLAAAHRFYVGVLGCGLGRESDRWIDFDFFGHQVTVHLAEEAGEAVPTNHKLYPGYNPIPPELPMVP